MERAITINIGPLMIKRQYPVDDPIWALPDEKAERKAIADAQRDLAQEADARSHTQYVVRG